MNVNLTAKSVGERVVLAVAVMGLVLQMVGDEIGCTPKPEPMTIEKCHQVCGEYLIERMDGWTCACHYHYDKDAGDHE